MRKLRRVGSGEDDPLDGVANFFDLGVILALGFMVPLMARMATPPQQSAGEATASAAQVASEQDRVKMQHFRPTKDPLSGEGARLGVAYRLKSGEVVYVPDRGAGK